jgi:hypothetical protein
MANTKEAISMVARLRNTFCNAMVVIVLSGAEWSIAAECPSSQNPKQGFRVSIGSSATSEVYRLDTGDTRAVERFKGGAIAEKTYYQGLIHTEQLDNGRRTTFTPKSSLKTIFPLKVGQRHRVDFDVQTADGQKSVLYAEYKVIGQDQILIGGCRYDVFKVEHRNGNRKEQMQFIDTEWYSPDLRMIVAREYKHANGETIIRKYDAISTIDAGTGK